MPPALPRPPTCTWALTTTGYPTRLAWATASSTVSATPPGDTGMPQRAKYCLPWYSNRSICSEFRERLGACAVPRMVVDYTRSAWANRIASEVDNIDVVFDGV